MHARHACMWSQRNALHKGNICNNFALLQWIFYFIITFATLLGAPVRGMAASAAGNWSVRCLGVATGDAVRDVSPDDCPRVRCSFSSGVVILPTHTTTQYIFLERETLGHICSAQHLDMVLVLSHKKKGEATTTRSSQQAE